MTKSEKHYTKSILGSILLALSFYILSNVFDIVFTIVFGNYIGVEYEFLASPIASLILLFLVLYVYRNRISSSELNCKVLNAKTFLLSIIMGLILRVLRDPIFMFPQIIGALEIPHKDDVKAISNTFFHHSAYVIHMVFIIPIMEEVIFRKVIFKQLATLKPVWIILCSSLLFSLIHINPFVIPGSLFTAFGAFVFGVVAGIIYYSTKKLLYVIILHAVTNIVSYIIKINQLVYYDVQGSLNYNLIYWLIIIVSLVLCILFLRMVHFRNKYM